MYQSIMNDSCGSWHQKGIENKAAMNANVRAPPDRPTRRVSSVSWFNSRLTSASQHWAADYYRDRAR
jgi:hypothetical protein